MINLRITGLYNRGQQDEYVELEAAARCDLEGLMLVRYLYNAEGFPIYSQARLYEFPDTNLRKGNRVRLYSGFTKEKKVRTPEGVTCRARHFPTIRRGAGYVISQSHCRRQCAGA